VRQFSFYVSNNFSVIASEPDASAAISKLLFDEDCFAAITDTPQIFFAKSPDCVKFIYEKNPPFARSRLRRNG
jgi:hypothetical protein